MERSKVVAFQQGSSFSLLGLAIVLVLIANIIFAVTNDSRVQAYSVRVDGKEIALVSDNKQLQEVVDELKEESKEIGDKVVIPKVEFVRTKADANLVQANEEVEKQLADILEPEIEGFALEVNGQVKVVFSSEEEAKTTLNEFKLAVAGKNSDWVTKASFEEDIKVTPVKVAPEKLMQVDEAVEYLKTGGVKAKIHKVKSGENLWTIARANDMRVAEILKANPGLDEEKIQIDQELKLVQTEPVVNLVATFEKTVVEPVGFETKTQKDSRLTKGQQKVLTPGKKGEKEVTYKVVIKNGDTVEKEVLDAKILKKPTTQVVAQGTKRSRAIMVASRGDGGGSGDLVWPARGSITSGYGQRWGRAHTGIDIDGDTGDPIYAAASGKVIHVGWYYEYGKTIIIDHGNGFTTLYAHLSDYDVSEGDEVSASTRIGDMGNTGRSTGSHLHFETMVNGAKKNPMNYLR